MTSLMIVLTTFGACAVSAIVPLLNAELYLVGMSAMSPSGLAVPLVVAGALGQMAGKSLMYYAGVGALNLPGARLRRMVAQVKERYREGGTGGAALGWGVILVSAIVGIPPFYVVSVACGLLRVPFIHFFALGLAGRLVRFGLVVLAPQMWKFWW